MDINTLISHELNVKLSQVTAAINLLDEGATVPFISRYRKEVTGGLSDTQLRCLEERLQYLRQLAERRQAILHSIEQQGKLTSELKNAINSALDKTTLEDLYLPYKPKRRTKAQIAREAGLEPLAIFLLQNAHEDPQLAATAYINAEHAINNETDALEGARYILMEMLSEHAALLSSLRDYIWQYAQLTSKVIKDKETQASKFSDYFSYNEAIKKIPSHRALALFRGQNEEFLRLHLEFTEVTNEQYCLQQIALHSNLNLQHIANTWLSQTIEWTWKIKLFPKVEVELMSQLREQAETEAIRVFKDNLSNLLLMPPAGNKVVLGLDPGLRTGVKVVVVDGTGKLLEYTTIFPHAPRDQWQESLAVLTKLINKYTVELVSIGNGTASRETDRLVAELIKNHDLKLTKIIVSEAGASVYSASELAANEFPDLDVSYRGAVSIARRLQDPLAELVKIDPKAIGVGQYQHDVNQIKLEQGLTAVMEDCVNAVGADVNTASVPLLKAISGLNESIAKNIVTYREQQGRFKNRNELKKIPRLGDKTFEQCVGFLRITNGTDPLDASAVHPESYPAVEKILNYCNKSIHEIMGNSALLNSLEPQKFVDQQFGLPTIKDIISELNKPGRDPRPEFKTASFKEGVEAIEDLAPDMLLEGVVSNVTNFGAFVDIGVHQDGLVHISHLSKDFVHDPHQVVKVGQVVKVKVLTVDVERRRISLSMK